ncbi:MAG TPA: ATPase, T2SS/T4P/T4SS family [Planctomycetota bacterium]|jgi:twitching motility protein PilT
MAAIDRLLVRAKDAGASDLFLADGQPPRMRRMGQATAVPEEPALLHGVLAPMLKEIAPPGALEACAQKGECLFAHTVEGQVRVRASCYRHVSGMGAVFRLIPLAVPALQDLGLPPALKEMCQSHMGLVILTGPSGAGASTTIAAMINEINTTQSRRILTVENPIEYVHTPNRCAVVQRELGEHVKDRAAALYQAGRAGFDVIYCGALESPDSIAMATTVAQMGILVLATMRGASASRTVEHLVNVFPGERQPWVRGMLGNVLRCVSAQVLVNKADGSGRCAANEVLVGTPGVSAAIREGFVSKLGTMIQSGGADGMGTLDDALNRKVQAQVVTAADAMTKANDKARFQAMIEKPPAPAPAAPAAPAASNTKIVPPPPAAKPKGSLFGRK